MIESRFLKRAQEEADFLRDRLFNLQERVSAQPERGESHIDYLHTLYALIDKEHSIYVRLKLIDTPEAHRAIEDLDGYKILSFLPKGEEEDLNVSTVYPTVKQELVLLIKEISGEDFDPLDFETYADW